MLEWFATTDGNHGSVQNWQCLLAIKLMLLHMVDAMGKILYLCQVQGTYRSGANMVPLEHMSADGSRSWANKNG